MGSMMEGNEGWAREDELDLSPEDDALDHTQPSAEEPIDEELETASEKTVEPVDAHDEAPSTTRRSYLTTAQGSVDETASIPDDSPSVHVSETPACNLDSCLMVLRDPFLLRRAVAL